MGKVYSLSVMLDEADDWSKYNIYGLNLKCRSHMPDFPLLRNGVAPRCSDSAKMSLIRSILAGASASASTSRLGRAAGLSAYWSHLPSFMSFSMYFIHVMQSFVACPEPPWKAQYFIWSILEVSPLMGCDILNHDFYLSSRRIWLLGMRTWCTAWALSLPSLGIGPCVCFLVCFYH